MTRRSETVSRTLLTAGHLAAGELRAARSAWERALTILDQLDHPDADDLRRKLYLRDAADLTR